MRLERDAFAGLRPPRANLDFKPDSLLKPYSPFGESQCRHLCQQALLRRRINPRVSWTLKQPGEAVPEALLAALPALFLGPRFHLVPHLPGGQERHVEVLLRLSVVKPPVASRDGERQEGSFQIPLTPFVTGAGGVLDPAQRKLRAPR